MKTRKHQSILASISGAREHVELDSAYDGGKTWLEPLSDKVRKIETPKEPIIRWHEAAGHALHTSIVRDAHVYEGICDNVTQLVEDCRLHWNCWPEDWRRQGTPRFMRESAERIVRGLDLKMARKADKNPKLGPQSWPAFAHRLRAAAISCWPTYEGSSYTTLEKAGFKKETLGGLGELVEALIRGDKIREAAEILQTAFFPEQETREGRQESQERKPGQQSKRPTIVQPKMKIIDLPKTMRIKDAKKGKRRAVVGPRLHRPSLRKEVLPARLFTKEARRKPAGTILVDASGSMGDWNEVSKWITSNPFATVAYYAGGHHEGWLYIYARKGMKAAELKHPPNGGNTVDGPAISWLLEQEAPLTMVTDRGFCGAVDSEAQKRRLASLEQAGRIKVINYRE